eukprot:66013_1
MNFNTNHHTNDSVAPKKKTTMLALAGLQIGHSDVDTHYGVDMEETLPSFQGLTMEDTLSFLKSPSVATAVLPPAIAIGVFLIAYNVISGPKDEKVTGGNDENKIYISNVPDSFTDEVQAEESKEPGSETVQSKPTVPVIPVTVPTVPVPTVPVITVPVVTVPVTVTNTNETETETKTPSRKTLAKTSKETVESSKERSEMATCAAIGTGLAILFSAATYAGVVCTAEDTDTLYGQCVAVTNTTVPVTEPVSVSVTTVPVTVTNTNETVSEFLAKISKTSESLAMTCNMTETPKNETGSEVHASNMNETGSEVLASNMTSNMTETVPVSVTTVPVTVTNTNET